MDVGSSFTLSFLIMSGSSPRHIRHGRRYRDGLTKAGIASGSRRAVVTLLDQGLASVSNFSVGVVVARIAGAAGLGGFAIAYAGWQIIAAMHRSLVTDPMAIQGDVRQQDVTDRIRRGLAADILLGLAGAVILAGFGLLLTAMRQHTFGIAVMAMAPWLPILTVQDYWRWMGFLSRKPGRALANDVVFNCVQGAALAFIVVAHVHSVVAVIASWGAGGVVGALFGLRQYRVLPTLRGGLALLRSRWSFSKWIAGNQLVSTGQLQIAVVIAGAILGPVGLGGFKAAQALVLGPAGVLIQAGGSIGLPEASKAYQERQWPGLMRVARWVTSSGVVAIILTVLVIAIWGRKLLSILYGPAFGHFHETAILVGLGFICSGFTLGPILVLKATRGTHWLFHTQIVTMVASLSATAVLSILYGVNGAAIATIIASGVTVACLRAFQRRAHRAGLREGTASPADAIRATASALYATRSATPEPTSNPAG